MGSPHITLSKLGLVGLLETEVVLIMPTPFQLRCKVFSPSSSKESLCGFCPGYLNLSDDVHFMPTPDREGLDRRTMRVWLAIEEVKKKEEEEKMGIRRISECLEKESDKWSHPGFGGIGREKNECSSPSLLLMREIFPRRSAIPTIGGSCEAKLLSNSCAEGISQGIPYPNIQDCLKAPSFFFFSSFLYFFFPLFSNVILQKSKTSQLMTIYL